MLPSFHLLGKGGEKRSAAAESVTERHIPHNSLLCLSKHDRLMGGTSPLEERKWGRGRAESSSWLLLREDSCGKNVDLNSLALTSTRRVFKLCILNGADQAKS